MGTVVMLQKNPVFVNFNRQHQVVFNLNTEILIRNNGGKDASLWETIAEVENPETHEITRTLDVNLESLRLYLWAALQEDAARNTEPLSLDDVGRLLAKRKWVTQAVQALTKALNQYYGDAPGE